MSGELAVVALTWEQQWSVAVGVVVVAFGAWGAWRGRLGR